MEVFYATILVMVVTNQRILLAADSRKTYLDKNGIHKTGTIDKIYETDDCYYAVCGFHEEENGFSVHRLLHNCLSQFSDFSHAVKQITHSLATELKTYFTSLKKTSPAVFQQLKNISAAAGEVFLVKRHNNIPTAYLLDYHIVDGATIKVTVTSRTTTIADIQTTASCFWRAIGNTGFLPASITEVEWAKHPEAISRRVIEEGSKRTPAFVSPPVNMLEITTAGVRWIEKTPTAPNHF